MEYLENRTYNIVAIVVMVIIATVATAYAPYENGAGMALLILIWIPLIVGVITLIAYLIVQAIAGKLGWVATGLGVLFLAFYSFSALFS